MCEGTEDQTFERLRRRPLETVYHDVNALMKSIMQSRQEEWMSMNDPQIVEFVQSEGYTVSEVWNFSRVMMQRRIDELRNNT